MVAPPGRRLMVGRITGLFGVHGWVKVYSYTRPRVAIINYSPWLINKTGVEEREVIVAEGHAQGKGVVARIDGCADRDQAAELINSEIAISVDQMPATKAGEYYWAQLEGLAVINRAGQVLGQVSHLFETGANDVLVVQGERERLIPFGRQVIERVDLAAGVIQVDWDAED